MDLRRKERANSLFYPISNSEDDVIPKKYRRIRSRRHKQIQNTPQSNSNNEQNVLTSPSKYLTISSSNLHECDDENTEYNKGKNNISVPRHPRKVPTTFGAERSHYKPEHTTYQPVSPEHAPSTERNESIWSYSSSTNRLLEDVEKLKELIFLRDIQLGFLPDECEIEFASCFKRLSQDDRFAVRRIIIIYCHIRVRYMAHWLNNCK